jgi:hypothetical protein
MAEIRIIIKKKRPPVGTEPPTALVCVKMVLASDLSSPAIGKSVDCDISKNGGEFTAPSKRVREISNGWYKIPIILDDLRSDVLILSFTGTDCAQNDYVFFSGRLRV